MSIVHTRSPRGRRLHLTLPLLAAVLSGACAQTGLDIGGISHSGAASAEGTEPAATRAAASAAAIDAEERANLKPEVAEALAEARRLRSEGRKPQALARLDAAAQKVPADKALMKERGLLALDVGQVRKAKTLLEKAHDPKRPDWRVLSALGAAASASGQQQEAQIHFAKALELAPDHPSILNNLALSYALDGKHDQAERLLRRASSQQAPSAISRQNLALLVGLKGNVEEARKVSEAALPPTAARANVSYLERLKSGRQVSRAEPVESGGIRAASAEPQPPVSASPRLGFVPGAE